MLRNDIGGQLGGTHFPLKLNYTESWRLVMTEPCRLREVTLFTNLGRWRGRHSNQRRLC